MAETDTPRPERMTDIAPDAALRDQLVEQLRADTYPYGRGDVRGDVLDVADAVMPVVEAALTAARDETARERQRAELAEATVQRAHRSLTMAENRAVMEGDARTTIAIRNARADLDRPADPPEAKRSPS